MLKKLRIKFVAVVMASVAVVLAVVFTGICVSEYQRGMNDVHEALSSSLDRAAEGLVGRYDEFLRDDGRSGIWESGSLGSFGVGKGLDGGYSGSADAFENGGMGPRIGGMGGDRRNLVPVGVYALDDAGTLTMLSGYTTAFIGDDVIETAASVVTESESESGEVTSLGLLYQKRTVDGLTYVAFTDAEYASSWKSLALTLGVAAIVVLAVFFVIALLLSRWALRPVEEAWNSQRQFVADASHELKTPLTVILANTSILLKHPDQSIASQSQWIESTQVEAESMQGLVNEMLELAQVESRANVNREDLDFSDLVAGEVLQFESVAFERGCQFDERVTEGVRVNGDEQRLRKMTSTLIENALKYVDEGGTVEVKLVRSGNEAKMAISNTGSTIAPEDLPHIFDRFYRTDKARTSGAGGFGLGLAIARETAREHDGDIICASDANGTTFTVTLPVA